MTQWFEPAKVVDERPLEEWPSVDVLLQDCVVRQVQGQRWSHRVIECGSGEPLLLYHGIGGHAETYARTLAALSENFHVFAVDALFHGGSSKDGFDLPAMYDLLADGFVDLIDALGFESVHFEGESMGAMFGVNVALRFPERVRRMVLSAGFYLLDTTAAPRTAHLSAEDLGELSKWAVLEPNTKNVRRRMEWLVADPARMTDDIVQVRRRLYEDPEVNASMRRVFNIGSDTFGLQHYDWPFTEEDCRSWKPETLVLWGEHNPGFGVEFGEYCANLIGADFYVVDDTGHWPQWEKPDEYANVMTDFLLRDSVARGKVLEGELI